MNRMFAGRLTIAAPFLVLLGGCVSLDTNACGPEAPPPPGVPCQIATTWERRVQFTADPTHAGAQIPALGGRLYLFGPEIKYPMTGDGSLAVLAYDGATPPGPDAVPLQAWQFDPVTLHRLLKRDAIGWGYTLPLVWPDLPPTLARVRLKVCYQPAKGTPLYSESEPMTLENPVIEAAGPVVTQSAKPRTP
jgi:hypothetical protein